MSEYTDSSQMKQCTGAPANGGLKASEFMQFGAWHCIYVYRTHVRFVYTTNSTPETKWVHSLFLSRRAHIRIKWAILREQKYVHYKRFFHLIFEWILIWSLASKFSQNSSFFYLKTVLEYIFQWELPAAHEMQLCTTTSRVCAHFNAFWAFKIHLGVELDGEMLLCARLDSTRVRE